jgi:hypothetical protein
MRLFLFSSSLLCFAPALVSAQATAAEATPLGSGPQVNQDRVVDFDYCYLALDRHDDNGNKRIDESEYLGFCQDFGGNTECLGFLTELPLALRVVWNQLSCECAVRGGDPSCCLGDNAHIPITGVLPDDPVLIEEQQFLLQSCLRTDQAIIAFCGPPPIPVIPPPPPAYLVRSPGPPVGLQDEEKAGIIAAAIIAFLIWLCCCRRRRWCFFAGGKDDNSSSDESSSSSDDTEDFGGMHHNVTQEGGEFEDVPGEGNSRDIEGGDYDDADADKLRSMQVDEEEDGNYGGTRTGRTVEEPEYEDEVPPPRPAGYDQGELPDEPDKGLALRPVTPPPAIPPREDPYELEHYVPDGGIIEHERTGEWAYDADGGWTPEERAERAASEAVNHSYEREVIEEIVPVDTRRQRHLDALDGGEIFDLLDEDVTESHTQPDDMFDWVIQSTLNTLDQKADDLKESEHDKNGQP